MAPAPLGWYAREPSAQIESSHGLLQWKPPPGADPARNPPSCLTAPDRSVLATGSMYCSVQPLPDHRFLAWWSEPTDPVAWSAASPASIRLALVDADRLGAIPDVTEA